MTKRYSFSDSIVTFLILLIGAAEIAHLFGIFLDRPFSECAVVFGGLALAALAVTAFFVFRALRRKERGPAAKHWTGAEKLLLVVFAGLLLTQIVYIVLGKNVYRQGDMTVETVGSFLENNGIYPVNPLTGNGYEGGIPTRLKILCLPTLYASLCSIFRVSPAVLVWQAVPAAVLLCCYGAYLCLGRSLFPENRVRQLCFMIAVALVLWVGNYELGVDGFNLLSAGWRGVSLRGGVLVPYAVSLCLRKKYLHALLCVLAEACVVWTLYGLGACAVVISGMALTASLRGRRTAGGEETK